MESWREYFETWIDKPLSVRSTGDEKGEDHFSNIAIHISTLLKLSKDDTVVDVGCDSGLVTERVAGSVKRIIGIDFIGEFIINALINPERSNNAHYIEADAKSLPFEADFFDKGYCYNMIHNLPTRECGIRVIGELIRVCKSKSTILIGDIPDLKKRYRYLLWKRLLRFRKGTLKEKAKAIAGIILPKWAKRLMKERVLKVKTTSGKGPELIWYDLEELKEIFEKQGIACKIIDQKKGLHDYYYRSNLIIEKGQEQSYQQER